MRRACFNSSLAVLSASSRIRRNGFYIRSVRNPVAESTACNGLGLNLDGLIMPKTEAVARSRRWTASRQAPKSRRSAKCQFDNRRQLGEKVAIKIIEAKGCQSSDPSGSVTRPDHHWWMKDLDLLAATAQALLDKMREDKASPIRTGVRLSLCSSFGCSFEPIGPPSASLPR
jgi:hypothetical protein